ncbi:Bug family tripartite tricarboxylate transporter substrate binding protein [Paracandidimonas soli]|uniref:Tripartite-type tricarboxylate transporter receptor subunit TctC n=1 Tax=Paracandidimonas soli TaxID=1917182 RepID=A0A4R3USX0_9BURK|nr:tripartite tricarboxylate transporter substrate binding protein [Paracandidimonas soli]TCU93134.1 tripartite-type tricarboxylate transporter receptor subunit TctC [Paracandidimonas soli]
MKTKAILAGLLVAASAQAYAAYPEQPIKIVVGYAAGGTTDLLARALGEQLSTELNVPVVIENKAGAAGSIAAADVEKSKPDGYTVFVTTVSSHGMNPALYSTLNYDPIGGFEPISMLASIPLVLITDPKLELKTVDDLVAKIKANPGAYNYSSSGNGSPPHIAAAIFADMADLKLEHVPYRGGALANTAVIAGDVQFSFATLPAALPQVKGGKLTALAVTTKERSPELPDVPAVSENASFPGYEINTWNALLAPKGTPPEIIAKLNAAVVKVMNAEKLQQRFRQEGAIPQSSTPEELWTFVKGEIKRWDTVVRKLDIRIN